jgi:hypothetical protein
MLADQHEEETVQKDGFEFTFYPGFASACVVVDADGTEHELYKQEGVYDLPKGQKKPRSSYKLKLKGGARKQDVTLDVRDPALRIAKITIELYGEDYPEDGRERDVMQTMTIPNHPATCPPHCT